VTAILGFYFPELFSFPFLVLSLLFLVVLFGLNTSFVASLPSIRVFFENPFVHARFMLIRFFFLTKSPFILDFVGWRTKSDELVHKLNLPSFIRAVSLFSSVVFRVRIVSIQVFFLADLFFRPCGFLFLKHLVPLSWKILAEGVRSCEISFRSFPPSISLHPWPCSAPSSLLRSWRPRALLSSFFFETFTPSLHVIFPRGGIAFLSGTVCRAFRARARCRT